MALSDIVNITITLQDAAVSRAGFGTPLAAVYHTHWTERVRSYAAATALATLVSEGFSTSSLGYKLFQSILAQNPRVRALKMGRRGSAWTQIVHITPSGAGAAAAVSSVKVAGTAATFTNDGTPTLAELCTGLAAAINALAAGTVADGSSGTHVVCTTSAAATLLAFTSPTSNLTVVDKTADAGVAADMAAIRAEDSDFYGILLDSNSTAEIKALAADSEANLCIFAWQSADTDMLASGTAAAALGGVLKGFAYARTVGLYHPDPSSYAAAAWLGVMLSYSPGNATFAFKTLKGVSVTAPGDTATNALKAQHVCYYVDQGGIPVTMNGVTAGGSYADTTIFVDWLQVTMQARVFRLLATMPKVPYEDKYVDMIRGEMQAVLEAGIGAKGLASDPAPYTFAPPVLSVDPNDRAARLLPDVGFAARLAGAIQETDISGTLSV